MFYWSSKTRELTFCSYLVSSYLVTVTACLVHCTL